MVVGRAYEWGKNLSPNQGDGMASMRRKSVAVRIIVGAGVCLYWKEVSLEPQAGAGVGLLWTSLPAEGHPGAAEPRARAASLPGQRCRLAPWGRTSCSALPSGLRR